VRILHLISAYPPADFVTGPPQQVHRLVRELRAGGEDVRVVTTNGNGSHVLHVAAGRWTEHEGVPVFYGHRLVRAGDLSWDAWRAVDREARSADLIHVSGLFSSFNLSAAAASRRSGVPVVVSPRGMLDPEALAFSPRKKALYFRLGGSRALAEAAAFHVTSEMERTYVANRLPGARIEIVPNGVVVPTDDNLALWKSGGAAAPTVLFLGRIHPKKNVIPLVNAWASVAPRHPETRLVLAGPDDHGHRAEVERRIAELGLGRSVELAGFVGGEDLSRLLATSACLVLPSLTENFGNVVAEALAHRIPVIASTGTPWSGLRDRDCGWWIQPTVDGLATAIDEALALSPADLSAKGERGRRWMIEAFSWTAFARRMADFYRDIVARRGPRASGG
jgi:glycosyltransferase involved in cell wall biosynthesis